MMERPILFSGPMVRALLDGRKTQTRRVVKPMPPRIVDGVYRPFPDQPNNWQGFGRDSLIHWYGGCPYGVPGDRLWVRESGYLLKHAYDHDPVLQMDRWEIVGWEYADGTIKQLGDFDTPVSEWRDECKRVGRPSIHMPRWASRLTLQITDVRVERLNDCSEADALAEGVLLEFYDTARAAYADLWEHINGPGSWDANPWVWAVSFEVVK